MSTMREVAALAGVSGKTVSRVINGDRYVSAAVQERVEQAVKTLDYVPNMLSQTFRTGRDSAIGIAVPDLADPFFGALIQAVFVLARRRSTAVLVTALGQDPADERPALEALLRRHVAGLIIAPVAGDQSYLRNWLPNTEIVFVDRPPRRLAADSVIEDDLGGAGLAIRHLLSRGNRRIAFLGNESAVLTTGRRFQGYRSALEKAGVSVAPELVQLYDETGSNAVAALRTLLDLTDPPSAIFSADSQSSIAVVPLLHSLRRTDIDFVSFGDFPMAAALDPPVTVLDQNPTSLGRAAAARLFERIDQPGQRRKRQQVLPVELKIR